MSHCSFLVFGVSQGYFRPYLASMYALMIMLGLSRWGFDLFANDSKLPIFNSIDLLGVSFDADLRLSGYITATINKCCSTLKLL